jgi:hypothetical protein
MMEDTQQINIPEALCIIVSLQSEEIKKLEAEQIKLKEEYKRLKQKANNVQVGNDATFN